ncbi:MAG: dTMP kinase [Rhodovibrionaceae bacterium]
MTAGKFITLEGGEGSGKSTQVAALASALRAEGLEVVETREPGGSLGAEAIRELLIHGASDRWDAMTETLLHYAARRDHLRRVVWPALDSGAWVISDRFADSTLAYQGYGQGLDLAAIARIHEAAVGDFRPDLTFILDLPAETGLRRAAARKGGGERYEGMGLAFHQRLRAGFLEIAKAEPLRCVVIDAAAEADGVTASLLETLHSRLLAA